MGQHTRAEFSSDDHFAGSAGAARATIDGAGGVDACQVLRLADRRDGRGRLTIAEVGREVPFAVHRVYFFDVPVTGVRGAHAHRSLEQVLISISGTIVVSLDDGRRQTTHELTSDGSALYIAPMVWRSLVAAGAGTIGLVLASALYDENDYYRDYSAFLRAVAR
jgi:quercetin dioxygenase-like cupin family protein